jgi:CRISPR-associated endonuclease/helicase Cas3
MRLLGLADKVLIVDEAHAYDAYMGVELMALLRFHAALGGSAVVLSATLPLARREELVTAWIEGAAGGRRRTAPLFGGAPPRLTCRNEYPLVTLVDGRDARVVETGLEVASWLRTRVGVKLIHDPLEARTRVVEAVRGGAAVAWIRNTVRDCLTAAAELRSLGLSPDVFHARFAQCDRLAREADVLRTFGEKATSQDRAGRVLVATQVIEQSLDLDFDLIVTDLAPVDLLIQRAGRLWRHPTRNGDRPAITPTPELVVLTPPLHEPVRSDWISSFLPGTARVYEDAGILWRTATKLAHCGALEVPGGIRSLIEDVYASDTVPEALQRAAERAEGKRRGDASLANFGALEVADGYSGDARPWMDDMRVPTRLGQATTTIRLGRVQKSGAIIPWAAGETGPPWHVWALSEVRVLATAVPAGALPDSQHRGLVDALRAEWGRFEQEYPLLPLQEVEPGVWGGTLVSPDGGGTITFRYTSADGLSYSR